MPDHLIITEISKSFPSPRGPVAVLRGVSLCAQPGETVAILGPSGAGKSTLLQIIGALDRPDSGTVQLGDTEVTALEGAALAAFRATRVGFVFQDHLLLPQLTVLENVLLPAAAAGNQPGAGDRARALLARVGLGDRHDAFPAQLSGGERQRVAIARAMVNCAGLLLCDEPTGNLDHDTGAGVVALFREMARAESATILMVTHNRELAAGFDTLLELRNGDFAPVSGLMPGGPR